MKLEFELTGDKGWTLAVKEDTSCSHHKYTSRRKALLSIVRRIELLRPGNHFKITLEDIE